MKTRACKNRVSMLRAKAIRIEEKNKIIPRSEDEKYHKGRRNNEQKTRQERHGVASHEDEKM